MTNERLAAPPSEDQPHSAPLGAMAFAALGVVFGDIGTSPLYSMQTVFTIDHRTVETTRDNVFGVISMVFWTITLIVTFKYVFLVMKADNEGEGGILALVHLLRDRLGDRKKLAGAAVVMGAVGAGLFYGDSVITPAISVMSAFEGLKVVNPALDQFVLPASVIVLTLLFMVQHRGTETIGRLFGPVMTLWFLTVGILGIPWIARDPEIVGALLPSHAIAFVVGHPKVAFVALGAVVLTITGAEALYADMGHFGPKPIKTAWFALVFPALTLNYLGQGAEILQMSGPVDPDTFNPFFALAPGWARVPIIVLAAMATVIASQAVISGAFSVSQQATRLGLLPRMNVKHTSKEEGGQIYIGSINWILYFGVFALIEVFESSAALADAYGLAVTGTLILTTLLFLFLCHYVWEAPLWKRLIVIVFVLLLEAVFFAANVAKVATGGWIPLAIATVVIIIMMTWRSGNASVKAQRTAIEGPLDQFVAEIEARGVPRVPGLAVFPHPDTNTTPLALRELVDFTHVLHETVVIVSIVDENVPHIRHVDRASIRDLGYAGAGIIHVNYHVGFNDSQDVSSAMIWAQSKAPDFDLDPDEARYFLSTLRLRRGDLPSLKSWRKSLFLGLSQLSADRTGVFNLPPERTVVMGGRLEL